MIEKIGSRRAVIGAGVAVAGGAMLAPLAFRRGKVVGGSDGIAVVPGVVSPFVDDPAELGRWTTMVGRPIRVDGGIGVIEAVKPVTIAGRLPAGVRQHPFTVRFAVDPAGAPASDTIANIDTTIEGLTRLFVRRGENSGGKAILTALFA